MKRLLTYTLVSVLLLPFIIIKSEIISLKELVERKIVSSGKISPDGNFVAHTLVVPRETYVDEDGKPYVELHITSIKGDTRKFISGKINIYGIQWSHDGQYIYYQAKRNDDEHISIYRIAIDGGESEQIVSIDSVISSYSLNSDSTKLVYIAKPVEDEAVKKLSDKGFKAEVYEESDKKKSAYIVDLLNLGKKHIKLAIDEHILSVAFHPLKNTLLMRVTPTPLIDDSYTSSSYRIYNMKSKLQTTFKTEGKLLSAQWSKDGKSVAIIGSEDKYDPAAGRLFIGDSKTGNLTEPVKNYPGHVKDIKWLSNYQVAFLGHKGTKSEVSVINLDNNSVSPRLATTNIILRSIDTDSSGKRLVGFGSESSHPRELYDLSSGKPRRLTYSNQWLDEKDLPIQKTITYQARDGVELQGILIYPFKYKKRKRYPLIMMVHGGPESHISDGWLDTYSYPIKHAASKGFAVFLPNYRGSTGRGVEFSKMGQADYAGKEFDDLVDAITHLSKIGLVDKKRVGITGGSYGGYASAWAATALSEHFAASVMFVGISDLISKFGTTDIAKEMYNAHARTYPWDNWQWMLERSPIYYTDKAKTPLLIMHGDSDTRVHPSQSMELYRYIKTRTKTPVRLVFYPDEGHGNRKSAAQLDYSMRLIRWMEFYLKGKNKANELPPLELNHGKIMSDIANKKDDQTEG